ncbi:MAG: hypothetical protein KGJ13_02440 [Patescibacteria group bacterium]|nr:hypothetical protein [Patescibacteria group bacterium]
MAMRADNQRRELADRKQAMIDTQAAVTAGASFETSAAAQLDAIKAANAKTPQNIVPQFNEWATQAQTNFLKGNAVNGRQQELMTDASSRTIARLGVSAANYASGLATQNAKAAFDTASTQFANGAIITGGDARALQDMNDKVARLEPSAANLKQDAAGEIESFKQRYSQAYINKLIDSGLPGALQAVKSLENPDSFVQSYIKNVPAELSKAREAVMGWGNRQAVQSVVDSLAAHKNLMDQWQRGQLKLTDIQALLSANEEKGNYEQKLLATNPAAQKAAMNTTDANEKFYTALGTLLRKGQSPSATNDPQTVATLASKTGAMIADASSRSDAASWAQFTGQLTAISDAVSSGKMTPRMGSALTSALTNVLPQQVKSNSSRPTYAAADNLDPDPVHKAYLTGSSTLMQEEGHGIFKNLSQTSKNNALQFYLETMNQSVKNGIPVDGARAQQLAMKALAQARAQQMAEWETTSTKNNGGQ